MDARTQLEFLAEIEELVEHLSAGLNDLRAQQDHTPRARELLTQIFRCAHSIKGVAAAAGFDGISDIAHRTETLLDVTRSRRIQIDDALIDTLEEAAHVVSEHLGTDATSERTQSTQLLLDRIDQLTKQRVEDTSVTSLANLPAEMAASLNEREKQLALEAIREAERLFVVTARFDLAAFDSEFQTLRETLACHGEIISTTPSVDDSSPDRVAFKIIFSSDVESESLPDLTMFSDLTVEELPRASVSLEGVDEAANFADHSQRIAPRSAHNFVRVDVEEIERLISSAHELFTQTAVALDVISNSLHDDSQLELKNLEGQLRESLLGLEEQMIRLRMVSVDRILQRGLRAGRVAARLSGKEIEFSVTGKDIRLDKTLYDAIANPLLHLVRNAVDHGIEPRAERLLAGKSPMGQVRLAASTTGGQARIVVADDGRGIDSAVVSCAAARLGLIARDEVLPNDQSLRMIFRPRFTTAATASTLSGRGVGLDVVETAVEQAGGAVRVRTEAGRGSEFEIRLPAAFGIAHALLVTSGFQYGIDANEVVDQFEIDLTLVAFDGTRETLQWKDQTLPLSRLRQLLDQEPARPNGKLQIVICNVGGDGDDEANGRSESSPHAIAVDRIIGTQEILVRSLGHHAARWRGVVGAAELRDGSVALALDLSSLLSA